MTELIGDICEPSDLFVPKYEDNRLTLSMGLLTLSTGYLILSGAKLWFHDGTKMVSVTSS